MNKSDFTQIALFLHTMQSEVLDPVLQNDFEWLQVRHKIKDIMNLSKLPDLNAVLLFIGVQELGRWKSTKFRKEEKQDLMHIAVCTLLSEDGFFQFEGLDVDGWPHFTKLKEFDILGQESQEHYLKSKIIHYFNAQ